MVEMVKVVSSNAHMIGHDPDANELHVQFKSDGPTYIYDGVTADEHAELMAAPSIGKHLLYTMPVTRGMEGDKGYKTWRKVMPEPK